MAIKAAVLLDFDNLFSALWRTERAAARRFGSAAAEWLPLLATHNLDADERRWLVARCYLNPAGSIPCDEEPSGRLFFSRFRPALVRAGFEVVDCPSLTGTGNNAADIRMVIDALDLLRGECRCDEFVIASGDSDFTPLLHRLRASDRRITVVAPATATPAYSSLADQLVTDGEFRALLMPPAEPAPADAGLTFHDLIYGRYAEAREPLNLAALAQLAGRTMPAFRQDGWGGAGSFSSAVARLELPGARLQNNYLWDEARHVPPRGCAPSTELPRAA